MDKSGTYHIIDNFLTSEHVVLENAHDVTLVTQCSSNHLHHLAELSERWKGPVSVAVFTFDDDFQRALDLILHHHFCSDGVFKYVTFHLVFPISRTPRDVGSSTAAAKAAESRLSCSSQGGSGGGVGGGGGGGPPGTGKSLFANYAIDGVEYPHNVLRNLAVNYVQTRYVFVVDVDMVPSEDLRPQFQKLLTRLESEAGSVETTGTGTGNGNGNGNGTRSGSRTRTKAPAAASSRTAYVVPSFEVKRGVAVPATKGALLRDWGLWSARPFYSELCAKCQRPTDFERWRDLPRAQGLRVAYRRPWADPWEPFYIARASLPLYDERFKQYGFNRISQVGGAVPCSR